MAGNDSLTGKQNALILALVAGQHIEAAAKTAKVSVRTAYRWQKNALFQQALAQAKDDTFNRQLAILKSGIGSCLNTLIRNMGERNPPAVQVSAARVWLENAISIYKTEQLELALDDVEHLLREGGLPHATDDPYE